MILGVGDKAPTCLCPKCKALWEVWVTKAGLAPDRQVEGRRLSSRGVMLSVLRTGLILFSGPPSRHHPECHLLAEQALAPGASYLSAAGEGQGENCRFYLGLSEGPATK